MKRYALALLLAIHAAAALGQDWAESRTRRPYTYVLDGGPSRLSDEEFVQQVALGPPLLQHMQSGSCVHSYWADFGARERAHQRSEGKSVPAPNYRRVYTARMARYQKMIAAMRKSGCQTIVCYVCIMTIGGDPDKRTGYWEFYDHWDDLRGLGIGPKPPTDPEQWGQRKADGSAHHFYRKEHPPYRPMYRYSQCLNNPYWQQYMKWVVRMNARCGYDGNFVDNANSHRCHCGLCQKLFREYLARKYSTEQVRDLFGPDVKLTESQDTLAGVETWRFWADTCKRFLAMIREAGSAEHGSWFVYPNGLRGRERSAVTTFNDCDLAMDEYSAGEFGSHPGTVFDEVIAGISVRHVNDNIFCHRHTYAANGRVRAALLTRGGYPQRRPAFMMNPDVAALGLAEAAAFSGGGAFLHRPATKRDAYLAEVRNQYSRFFMSHRHLYEGYVPYGQIALAAFAEQQFYHDRQHIALARRLLRSLMREHLLVDLVTERKWRVELLKHYRGLVIPQVRYMSDEAVRTALAFARHGSLMTMGDAAQRDLQLRERSPDMFARFRVPAQAAAVVKRLKEEGLARPVLEATPDTAYLMPAAYADRRDSPTRLTLHLVDYAVRLGRDAGPVAAIRNIQVMLPLPAKARARSVVFASPEGVDTKLPVETRDGAARFRIPSMRIYGVCMIEIGT